MNWARKMEEIASDHTASVHIVRHRMEEVDETARTASYLLEPTVLEPETDNTTRAPR